MSNPPRSPFFKGGVITRGLLPLFGKEGEGEIYSASLWARWFGKSLGVICLATLVACQQQMADQPRYEPLQKSNFFGDERSARPLVEGTVARGQLRADEALYTGTINGTPIETLPFPVTKDVLLRGQERFDIFCSPCHDRIGTGQGMVVKRGLRAPPSFHIDRLRTAPAGHFFDVISHGFGLMQDYAAQIPPEDRWAIVAYIRALQLSQNARLSDVPAAERRSLEAMP
ncbi:MAG TPA: cytochrome c [Candidatus Binatia bacterium]